MANSGSLNGVTIQTMAPPEVILDRFVRARLSKDLGFSNYRGKLNLDSDAVSPSLRTLLCGVQEAMNEALRLEGRNASVGVEHPPFHFDYLEVSDGAKNAHAFQHENFSFIVFTRPLVEAIWQMSHRLSKSSVFLKILRLDSAAVNSDAFHGLLTQIQLFFLVFHEYTHHIHQHCAKGANEADGVWTEFVDETACGSIKAQAQELAADGYATLRVLTFLLRGERRHSALAVLGSVDLLGTDDDELLLACFLVAAQATFCAFWKKDIDIASAYHFRHPPPTVRIEYTIRFAKMWCDQNGSVLESWFSLDRMQELFLAAAEPFGESVRSTWDNLIPVLNSPEYVQYDQQLFEMLEKVRKETANASHR